MEGLGWIDLLEQASCAVTVIGLPLAFWVFWSEQRKERENEEEEAYQLLPDACTDFLKVVLDHADFQLQSTSALADATPEQKERMLVIFDMLISLFERAYLIAFKAQMALTERRRRNSWDDCMRDGCRREDFQLALPLLLRGEAPDFVDYIRRLTEQERSRPQSTTV